MNKIILLSGVILLVLSCGKQNILKDTPVSIKEKIEDIKKSEVWNPPAKIYSYKFNNQTVYYFPARCCDIPSKLYDKNGVFICSPDGGFSGNGDGKYSDFFTTRTNEKLIWEDNRQ